MENETKIEVTKEQLQVMVKFFFVHGSLEGGLSLHRDECRKQLKEYDCEEILKFSDIIKAFGSFTEFKKFFREIDNY